MSDFLICFDHLQSVGLISCHVCGLQHDRFCEGMISDLPTGLHTCDKVRWRNMETRVTHKTEKHMEPCTFEVLMTLYSFKWLPNMQGSHLCAWHDFGWRWPPQGDQCHLWRDPNLKVRIHATGQRLFSFLHHENHGKLGMALLFCFLFLFFLNKVKL